MPLTFLLVLYMAELANNVSGNEDFGSRPRKVEELIEYWGYASETHWITTSDGYILAVHRIPAAAPLANNATEPRPIAFLLHGIFGTSARWTLGPPDKSLAYILADNGFDVWMGNTRGNSYSRNHTSLDPDVDRAFWNFDLETISIGDLPAIFDYIVDNTIDGGPFFYICHSMGCAEILILLSEKPEYNDFVDAVFLMAPPVFMGHSKAGIFTGFADLAEQYMGYKEIRKAKEGKRRMLASCTFSFVCKPLAARMLSMSVNQLNMTMLPIILDHTSHGSSSKVVYHFSQLMEGENLFRKYDYGLEENPQFYNGSTTPPDFNLSIVSAPIYIFYGNGDKLIVAKDVRALAKALPSTEALYEVGYPGWNHNDFVYAIEAKKWVYDKIIEHMRNSTSV